MDTYFLILLIMIGVAIFMGLFTRMSNKERVKKHNKMTQKTIATITKITSMEEESYNNETGMYDKHNRYFADYSFDIGLETYTGYSELSPFARKKNKKVVIYYNPENPQENVSKYTKEINNGIYVIKAIITLLFILLVLPLIILLP